MSAVAAFDESGLGLLADDILAQLNAFIADEYRRPGDELADLMLALAAESAIERTLRIAAGDLAHSCRRGAAFSVPGVVAVVRSSASKCVSSRQSAFLALENMPFHRQERMRLNRFYARCMPALWAANERGGEGRR
jgi:hypothetical protein